MMRKSTKQIKRAKAVNNIQGIEPNKPIVTDSDILDYYNWYFHNTTAEESIEFLYKYLKDHKLFTQLAAAESMQRYKIPNWVCYMARILTRDIPLPEAKWFKFKNFLGTLEQKTEKKTSKRGSFRRNIESAQQKQTNALLEEVEVEIDRYIDSKGPELDVQDFCLKNQIVNQAVNEAINHINSYIDQLKLAAKGEIFGYSGYTKAQFNNLYNSYGSLRNQLQSVVQIKKRQRKVKQIKKEKSPKLDKFKFKLESKEHKVVSVSPLKIIGSKFVVTYNTKYGWLGFYKAESGKDLDVKGTSIYNYDRPKCFRKVFKGSLVEIQNMGQREFLEFFEKLTKAPMEQRSQVNEDTLILRVL